MCQKKKTAEINAVIRNKSSKQYKKLYKFKSQIKRIRNTKVKLGQHYPNFK